MENQALQTVTAQKQVESLRYFPRHTSRLCTEKDPQLDVGSNSLQTDGNTQDFWFFFVQTKKSTPRPRRCPRPGGIGPWATCPSAWLRGWKPCPWKAVGTECSLRSLPTQPLPCFHDVRGPFQPNLFNSKTTSLLVFQGTAISSEDSEAF